MVQQIWRCATRRILWGRIGAIGAPVHGRVRSVAAKPNAIADEGVACRLSQWHLVGVFTGRDKSTDAIHPVVRGECYDQQEYEKARHDRICGSVVGT